MCISMSNGRCIWHLDMKFHNAHLSNVRQGARFLCKITHIYRLYIWYVYDTDFCLQVLSTAQTYKPLARWVRIGGVPIVDGLKKLAHTDPKPTMFKSMSGLHYTEDLVSIGTYMATEGATPPMVISMARILRKRRMVRLHLFAPDQPDGYVSASRRM